MTPIGRRNLIILGLLFFCGGGLLVSGIFIGRGMVEEKPIPIQAELNIDSLKNAVLVGKVDSVDLAEAIAENDDLRAAVYRAMNRPAISIHDTIPPLVLPTKVLSVTADTTFAPIDISGTINTNLDTIPVAAQSKLHLSLGYLGAPLHLFTIKNISLDPFTVSATTKCDTLKPIKLNMPGFLDNAKWYLGGVVTGVAILAIINGLHHKDQPTIYSYPK